MIHIDTLRLHLPAGLQHRAAGIARLVGEHLASHSLQHSAALEKLAITLPAIPSGTPDGDIAQMIAAQIVAQVTGEA